MPQESNSPDIKDKRWVIKTFRPLLKRLNIQNIPEPSNFTIDFLIKDRNLALQGMGRCIVIIEQQNYLPENISGFLTTSYDTEADYFKLHIVINSRLCVKYNFDTRCYCKLAAVHEFVHTVAALSAISRVRSKELIKRLREIFQKKAHTINYEDIIRLSAELETPEDEQDKSNDNDQRIFPDEHFRLGFEDMPVSYPILFEEFLISQEMLEEYFSVDFIKILSNAIINKEVSEELKENFSGICVNISKEKSLSPKFVIKRIIDFIFP